MIAYRILCRCGYQDHAYWEDVDLMIDRWIAHLEQEHGISQDEVMRWSAATRPGITTHYFCGVPIAFWIACEQ